MPLRRRATSVIDSAEPGWLEVGLGFSDAEQLAAELCGYGADVVALSPVEVRDAVVRRLQSVLQAIAQAS